MSMFTRAAATYDYDPAVIGHILRDDANPLRVISELIPSGSKVLDVGAGSGILGVLLKNLPKELVIDGIEPDPHAAELARPHYRSFRTGLVQDSLESIARERYDYIVMADVLEHFPDPESFLRQLVSGIPDGTKIVLSIPNVAFGAVRLELLNGNFRYVDSGILEKTHLRFFTLETLLQMVSAVGLAAEKLCFLQRDFLAMASRRDLSDVGWTTLRKLADDETASAYQFVVVLSRGAGETEKASYGTGTRLGAGRFAASVMKGWFRQKGRNGRPS